MNTKIFHILLFALLASNSPAASTPPSEDIHFIAEHLAEAAQDARYYAMPWPIGNYKNDGWKPLVSIAIARDSAGFATAEGGLLSIGLSRALSATWALDLIAYYDRFNVSGSSTHNTLSAFSVNGVPLDLPETAIFSNPRGKFTHTGFGAVISHDFASSGSWNWDLFGGLLYEELDLQNFTFNYQLTGGLNAGATGTLDHSGSNHLAYGFLGIQCRKNIGSHYQIIPRLILAKTLEKGDFKARITGSTFDLSTENTNAAPHHIGDDFIYIGMSLLNRDSHFEMDLGAILGYELFEVTAHEGVQSAMLLSLTWRR